MIAPDRRTGEARTADPREAVEARVAELAAQGALEAAAQALIEGYGPQVHGYLRSLLRDAADGDDAYSIWTERVWRGLPTWHHRASARTWAYRVAWHAASRLLRDPWRRRRTRLASSAAEALPAASGASLERSAGPERRLREVRAVLSAEEQSLLILRIDRGLAWDEVAAVLSRGARPLDAAAVRKRFERLKRKIARAARDRGLLRLH